MDKNYIKILFVFTIAIVFAACSSSVSKNTKEDKTIVKQKPAESLPPGNANVVAQIKEVNEEEKNITATINIEEVFGYGPSTPVIPPGSEIKIYVSKSLIKEKENKFIVGDELSMRIAFVRGANEINKWMFKYFIKKTK
ncbi:MAG: hypothetical protein P8Z35_09220 [Ignavibacteriaceae bacterium]|jgi:hypothetical protein